MAAAIRPLDALGTCRSSSAVTIQTSLSGGLEADSGPADVVNDDRIEFLTRELVAPVGERALAVLGGEADEQLAGAAALGERREHVRSTHEAQVQFPAGLVLLELAGVRVRGPVVGDGGRHQQHVACVEARGAGVGELGGGPHVDVLDSRRARDRDVGGDDRDLGAAPLGLLGEREAHPPGGAVADEAHGVDRLARPARGDQHVRTVEFAPDAAARSRPRPAARAARAAGRSRTRPASRASRCRARARSRRARAASRGWPGSPRARTSRCSWPERRSAVAGTRARPPSAGCRRCRARAWRASARSPGATRKTSACSTSARCESGACSGSGSPGKTPRSGSGSHSVTSTGAPVMPAKEACPTKRVDGLGLDDAHAVARPSGPGG